MYLLNLPQDPMWLFICHVAVCTDFINAQKYPLKENFIVFYRIRTEQRGLKNKSMYLVQKRGNRPRKKNAYLVTFYTVYTDQIMMKKLPPY